jgi:hypothetical protein
LLGGWGGGGGGGGRRRAEAWAEECAEAKAEAGAEAGKHAFVGVMWKGGVFQWLDHRRDRLPGLAAQK